jgi:anhydro-N-acetylmuramic acid kinase
MPAPREIFAGVMSGTSLDGVDAVLADFTPGLAKHALLAATHVSFPTDLRSELLALQASADDREGGRAANALADLQRACAA